MSILLTWLKSFFSKGQNISIFIIMALVAYILYLRSNDKSTTNQNVQQIQVLQTRVDSLTKQIKYLNPRLDSTNKAIDTVKTKIRSNDTKLQDIQKTAKKSDSIISTFTPNQLQKYFSDY